MQDSGHAAAEAFGDALAPCWRPAPECRNRGAGHPDASCPDTRCTVRFGMGDVVRNLPSGMTIPDNVAPFPCKRAAGWSSFRPAPRGAP